MVNNFVSAYAAGPIIIRFHTDSVTVKERDIGFSIAYQQLGTGCNKNKIRRWFRVPYLSVFKQNSNGAQLNITNIRNPSYLSFLVQIYMTKQNRLYKLLLFNNIIVSKDILNPSDVGLMYF